MRCFFGQAASGKQAMKGKLVGFALRGKAYDSAQTWQRYELRLKERRRANLRRYALHLRNRFEREALHDHAINEPVLAYKLCHLESYVTAFGQRAFHLHVE